MFSITGIRLYAYKPYIIVVYTNAFVVTFIIVSIIRWIYFSA